MKSYKKSNNYTPQSYKIIGNQLKNHSGKKIIAVMWLADYPPEE